ncbi:uncharacterized protein [Euphorbia lathyris]|uniref:uncharacterized protein n=1 Tax=Euphorbia lathyris TaxID=212925 RepID=UPI0033143A45
MEEGGSILDAIYEDDDALEELEDIEMVDVEEGEITEQKSHIDSEHNPGDCGRSESAENQASQSENPQRKGNRKNKKKKKKKKRKGGSGTKDGNIDWFVLDTCRRLREKKTYMVYTAVGCLGLSRLTELVTEVDEIQSHGGEMTADGGRGRTGGGILWKTIKTKEPMAYKEIMKKAKEFEKQFKPQNIRQAPPKNKELSSQEIVFSIDEPPCSVPGGCQLGHQNQHEQSSAVKKHRSVHDRIRMPVSYDDLDWDGSKNDSAISEKHSN